MNHILYDQLYFYFLFFFYNYIFIAYTSTKQRDCIKKKGQRYWMKEMILPFNKLKMKIPNLSFPERIEIDI
jgi:hypothetical protein